MRLLSIQWTVIAAIRNDIDFPRVHANGRNPIKPRDRVPPTTLFSKRPATTTTTPFFHPALHLPRGGGRDVIPPTPPPTSQSTPDDDEFPPTTSHPSPYDYVPATALDDYGQSIQLRHAMKAPERYGTPLLACLCRLPRDDSFENAVLVASLQKNPTGIAPLRTPPGAVRPLAVRDDSPAPLRAALVSSGLRADADFLLDRLRRYCVSEYWFRYDDVPHVQGEAARAIRRTLLDFMGYDWNREVGGSGSGEEEETTRAGRPLGIGVLVLGLEDGRRPTLTVIRANGSEEGYVAHAMGVGSEEGNERLSRLWRRGMTVDEAKEMMRQIFREIAVERGWVQEGGVCQERRDETMGAKRLYVAEESMRDVSVDSEFTIVYETVTPRGIDMEYLKL